VTFEPRDDTRGVLCAVNRSGLVLVVQHGALAEETEDFLVVTNPGLLRCFEEAERTFSLDKSDLDCSHDAYTHDSESDEESSEEGDLLSRSIRTEDAAEDSTVAGLFSETCHCTLGPNNAPCSQALPRRYAVEYREQCLDLKLNGI